MSTNGWPIKLPSLVPSGRPKTPFVLLVLGLLAGGLVLLLLINTATAAGSFKQSRLQERNNELVQQQQSLQRDVDQLDTPQQLAEAALRQGMVPGGDPAFLELLPNGKTKVLGTPAPATQPGFVPGDTP